MPLLEYELFRRLIRDAFGLDYPPNKRELLRTRLDTRLRANGLRRYGEYYRLLSFESPTADEWRLFAEEITNNETYFFREGASSRRLAQILPEIARGRAEPVRALSAGCSLGRGGLRSRDGPRRAMLGGTRGSRFAASISARRSWRRRAWVAISGRVFTPTSRCRSGSTRTTTSREADGSFAVRSFLRDRVAFHRGNLAQSQSVRCLGDFDVVFCRNVLIYAEDESLARFFATLAALVRAGGICSWATRTPSTARRAVHLDADRRPLCLRSPAVTIRVLVVDDSSFIRRAVTRMLGEDTTISIVGQAAHGGEAIDLVHSCAPDVIMLDLEMPGVGGLDTLRRIMAERPTPVVLLSVHAHVDAEKTLVALAAGRSTSSTSRASPAWTSTASARSSIRKVRLAARSRPLATTAPAPGRADAGVGSSGVGVVVLGASTGGPVAIQRLLGRLPRDFPLPLLAVQHMPAGFTRAFAERLDALGALTVKEAEDGQPFGRGVLVAPGGRHVELRRTDSGMAIALTPGGPADLHVPSLDIAAISAATARGSAACLVVLTGMGSDGLEGARAVRAAGGVVVVQDEASSVIYGMPRAVAQAGLADTVLPLERIPDLLPACGPAAHRETGGASGLTIASTRARTAPARPTRRSSPRALRWQPPPAPPDR